MDILTGKWKIHIFGILLYGGKMRFMDLQREVAGIGSKMLGGLAKCYILLIGK